MTTDSACKKKPESLKQKLERIRREQGIMTDLNQASPKEDTKETAMVIQLPIWKKEERAAPASILRSALFGVVRPGRRRHIKNELMDSWKNVEVRYTGLQLDQADLDVFLNAMHLHSQRQHALGVPLPFKAKTYLREIGRSTGGANRTWFLDSILRLKANAVGIKVNGVSYYGSLIDDFIHDEENQTYALVLNPKLAALFQDDYVRLGWETRKLLKGDLQKYLHGYICSHRATVKNPHKIKLETLKRLTRSDDPLMRRYRTKIKTCMKKLQEVGVVCQWEITENDVLCFARSKNNSGLLKKGVQQVR